MAFSTCGGIGCSSRSLITPFATIFHLELRGIIYACLLCQVIS